VTCSSPLSALSRALQAIFLFFALGGIIDLLLPSGFSMSYNGTKDRWQADIAWSYKAVP
jgi:hypothetical protein